MTEKLFSKRKTTRKNSPKGGRPARCQIEEETEILKFGLGKDGFLVKRESLVRGKLKDNSPRCEEGEGHLRGKKLGGSRSAKRRGGA